MGRQTTISWTHHTFNPWWGCAAISPACAHCYAEAWAKRCGFDDLWTPAGPRRFFEGKHWRDPILWNRDAEENGERRRVFCASMADIFDNHPEVAPHREQVWSLIRATPQLDWLLLTKRIGNAKAMLPADWGDGYANVWILATLANQVEIERDIHKLLEIPATVHGISIEPALGEIDLSPWLWGRTPACATCPRDIDCECGFTTRKDNGLTPIDWVITGGESGSKARLSHPDWFRSLRDQCVDAGVAFHHKQNGEWLEIDGGSPVRQIDVGSREAELLFNRKTDRLIANDGRVFASPDELPVGIAARLMRRVGKLAAGRTLDGRIWDQFPKVAA